MTKSNKIFVGILTLLPIVLLAVYLFIFFSMFFSVFQQADMLREGGPPPDFFFSRMIPAFIVGIVMALASLGLLIYYIIHVVNNKNIDSTERLVWILIFIFAGMIGFPIYWYMRIWKNNPIIPASGSVAA